MTITTPTQHQHKSYPRTRSDAPDRAVLERMRNLDRSIRALRDERDELMSSMNHATREAYLCEKADCFRTCGRWSVR